MKKISFAVVSLFHLLRSLVIATIIMLEKAEYVFELITYLKTYIIIVNNAFLDYHNIVWYRPVYCH